MGITVYVTIYSILLVIITSLFLIYRFYSRESSAIANQEANIYCLMVTGKDDKRIWYARHSIKNFLDQEYKRKYLVIVNHHPELTVLSQPIDGVFEFRVAKTKDTTLGALRNISLQMVALNAYWTTWDDDDYRSPDYLAHLSSYATPNTLVSISSRYEINTNNGFTWVAKKSDGFVLFLAPFDNRIVYKDKDTLEDIDIISDFKGLGYQVKVLSNHPRLYIRLVHTNNTSAFVRSDRDYLVVGRNYSERHTTKEEQSHIREKVAYAIEGI